MCQRPCRLFLVFALLGGMAAPLGAVRRLDFDPAFMPGEMLVRLKAGVPESRASALGTPLSAGQRRIFRVSLQAGSPVAESVSLALRDPSVEWAQPNYRYTALQCAPPTDTYYASGDQDWVTASIHATGGWSHFTACPPGSAAITVAVLDTGVWSGHPDLSGALVPGYNVLDSTTDTEDDEGHGTFVSGLIASAWDGAGMAGVAPGVRIMPIKVLDSSGGGSSQSIILGIEEATARGAKVINMSLGDRGLGLGEQSALDAARAAGIVVVAAAGNDGANVYYPAAYPPVVAVGALDANGQTAFYSNRGANLDLVAPGGTASYIGAGHSPIFDPAHDIFSTACSCAPTAEFPRLSPSGPGTLYATAAGTSFAAPLVSAAAALIFSRFPSMTGQMVEDRLISTADDLGAPGWDALTGYGSLNLDKALADTVESSPYYHFTKTFNSPNPFYTFEDFGTNITLVMDIPQDVELTIFDVSGATVLKRKVPASELGFRAALPQYRSFSITWDGRNGLGHVVATGVYPYQVKAGGEVQRGKIAVVRGRR